MDWDGKKEKEEQKGKKQKIELDDDVEDKLIIEDNKGDDDNFDWKKALEEGLDDSNQSVGEEAGGSTWAELKKVVIEPKDTNPKWLDVSKMQMASDDEVVMGEVDSDEVKQLAVRFYRGERLNVKADDLETPEDVKLKIGRLRLIDDLSYVVGVELHKMEWRFERELQERIEAMKLRERFGEQLLKLKNKFRERKEILFVDKKRDDVKRIEREISQKLKLDEFQKEIVGEKTEEIKSVDLDAKLGELKKKEVNKEHAEKIRYLAEDLLNDLRLIYPKSKEKDERYKGANSRYVQHKLEKIWVENPFGEFKGRPMRDFRSGQKMVAGIDEFMNLESGFPGNWSEIEPLLRTSNIRVDDLVEARKRKGEYVKKVETEKLTIDDERAKESYFVELREMATTEEWNRAMQEILGYQEPQRSYAFGFMKVAYDWYMHPEKAVKDSQTMDRWGRTYIPILKKLGIKVDE